MLIATSAPSSSASSSRAAGPPTAMIRVVSSGYQRDWQVQFPKGIRERGSRYVVTGIREASRGGFYRAYGEIRRLV